MSLVFFIFKIKKIILKLSNWLTIYSTKHIYLLLYLSFIFLYSETSTNTILVNTSVAYAGNKRKLARLPECYSSCCIDYGKKVQQKQKGTEKMKDF